MIRPKLHAVPDVPVEAVDIYAKWRAEIASRDWGRTLIWSDRNPPIDLPDIQKRGWR
jgi:hypothetical protein